MRSLSVGFLTGIFCFAAAVASAQPVYLDVRANSTAIVAGLPSWNKQCSFDGYPRVHVRGNPKHGRITIEHQSGLVVPANAGECAGKKVGGTVIRYTPERNFAGQDSAILVIYAPHGQTFFRADVVMDVK